MSDHGFLTACHKLDLQAKDIFLYQGSHANKLHTNLPFYPTVDSVKISSQTAQALRELGPILTKYFQEVSRVRGDDPKYIFLRPDILVTEAGLKICEIETSVFGFSLGLFLSKNITVPHMIGNTERAIQLFCQRWKEHTGKTSGTFVYTDHSDSFTGQLSDLAQTCREYGVDMTVRHVQEAERFPQNAPFYRCFYWHERSSDYRVSQFCKTHSNIIPSGSDIYEGKQMLVLWHNPFLRELMTSNEQKMLDNFFLPTWLITPHVPKDFSIKISEWFDLAELPKSQRQFVVKRVGNHPDASWSRSVVFLHKRTRKEVHYILQRALLEPGEWVIQRFYGNKKYTIRHSNQDMTEVQEMKGRIRITPYYDFQTGELLVAKATIRRDTLFIHGATDSVNTVLSEE